jgi:hypothetical protein
MATALSVDPITVRSRVISSVRPAVVKDLYGGSPGKVL